MPRDSSSDSDLIALFCDNCENNLYFELISYSAPICLNCKNVKRSIRCSRIDCNSRKWICLTCDLKQLPKYEVGQISNNNCLIIQSSTFKFFIYAFGAVILLLALSFCCSYFGTFEDSHVNLIKRLKKNYPSQSNETWYHFLSVLEKERLSVKSITFLHGEDKRTSDCLRNELVSLYTKNKQIKINEITFSSLGFETKDYGFILEYYRAIVQNFRLLVTNLTEISGNIARIFHSLCDEVSSDIKPSLFIFTLKYEKNNENLKPIARATAILKEAWNDLSDSEIFPLLSRVIKNVVDVVPEKEVNC